MTPNATDHLLAQPFTLANGQTFKNRLLKSAMSEGLATMGNQVTPQLVRLYRSWAEGGAGLLVTGNVMIDKRALGEPGNVVLEDEQDMEMLRAWAQAGTSNNTQLWMQINHPGKQAMASLVKETVAPSAIPFRADMQRYFRMPRALEEIEIEDIISRYGKAAALAKKAGFTGVQIHGCHGYLVSQFLSGHHNQRTDRWGGSAENRMGFVMEVYKEIRRCVGKDFTVAIKLNSADFQRGGFSEEESMNVMRALAEAGIDHIEISGGTYEAPSMTGLKRYQKESTRQREAYFLEFAEKARQSVKVPLAVTGGFRTAAGINEALASGAIDMAGLARLLAVEPDAPARLLAGKLPRAEVKPISTGIDMVDKMALMEVTWYGRQLRRLGNGQKTKPNESGLKSLVVSVMESGWGVFRTRLRA